MNIHNLILEGNSGATTSSAATSAQSSASKEKGTIRGKFIAVPTGINILSDVISVEAGWIVARNVSKEKFMDLAELNPHLTHLSLLNGDVIFTEAIGHRVHNRLILKFHSMVYDFNRANEHEIRLDLDTDTLVAYNQNTMLAADVMIANRARLAAGINTPNVAGEIGYSCKLSKLTSFAPNYLCDAPDNHTELYFLLKLCYPYSIAQPNQFQMVFILYDRQHLPSPVSVISCGTMPVSEAVRGHIANLTGISLLTHPDRHRGHGYGGLPCSWANRGHADYTVTLDGARILSIHRDADLPFGVADPDLYAFDISLYELQEVATEALVGMKNFNEGNTAVLQAEFESQLNLAADDGVAAAGGGDGAGRGGAAAILASTLLQLDHLCV